MQVSRVQPVVDESSTLTLTTQPTPIIDLFQRHNLSRMPAPIFAHLHSSPLVVRRRAGANWRSLSPHAGENGCPAAWRPWSSST